jgi:hypothetical protein
VSLQLASIGLVEEVYTACRLLRIHDSAKFIRSAVSRLQTEVAAFWPTSIPSTLTPKLVEFIVWHMLLEGIQVFEEYHAYNTQQYEWLSPTSVPGVDIYGATFLDGKWHFAVVEIKWSENCAYTQITSTTQGLVHDLKKLFEGSPSNRLVNRLSALRCLMRHNPNCSEALEGLKSVVVGPDPSRTSGVLFVGFFVGDTAKATDKRGFDKAYGSFHKKAAEWGWQITQLKTYAVTGTKLADVLDSIAQGQI